MMLRWNLIGASAARSPAFQKSVLPFPPTGRRIRQHPFRSEQITAWL